MDIYNWRNWRKIEEVQNKVEDPINPFFDETLISKVEKIEKSIFTIEKTAKGLEDAIKMLEERFNTPTPTIYYENEIVEENEGDGCKLELLQEEYTDLESEIEHLELTLKEKHERMNQINNILSRGV